MSTSDALFRKRDYLGLLAIANRHREAVARVIHKTLDFVTKNPNAPFEVVREIAQSEGSKVAAAMNQRIIYLADIGMLAPMLGLLGTVFGIIRSFGTIGSGAARQGTRDVLLAAGVSEALVATSAGLIIGITSMAFYGLFRGRVQNLISELESATAHALALLALNYRKIAPAKTNVLVEEEY
jgi:biopolymer transport protein ExbB